ncbi:unnamed protein product [Symbiodinium natans]|uniref:Uncharacterized protein n=1 Tax=Symbiodinium natans TaxID=878477 RepID=A0A812HY04_9DINO|nr:unnamed protein product [Symbiodinium natans]
MASYVRIGMMETFRAATVGVFQGYVLIDLCFDIESLRGKFSSSKPFYLGRGEHPAFPDRLLILQLPMLLALASMLYVSLVRDRCWPNAIALVLLLGSLFAGNQVLKLRESMASQKSDGAVHAALVEVAWLHVLMFAMLSLCLVLLCAAGVRSDKQKVT